MKEMLVYGLPFAVIIIIVALLPSVDRLFLLRFVNMDLIGEYSVALKIAGLLYLVVNASFKYHLPLMLIQSGINQKLKKYLVIYL